MIHVIPQNDEKPHELGDFCWCQPKVNEDGVVVHNAADCREAVEDLLGEGLGPDKKWAVIDNR